jgi:hypothetical protein
MSGRFRNVRTDDRTGTWQPPGSARAHYGHGPGNQGITHATGGFDPDSESDASLRYRVGGAYEAGGRKKERGSGTSSRRRTLDWVAYAKLRERDRALRSVPVIVLHTQEPTAPVLRASSVSKETVAAAHELVRKASLPDGVVAFASASADVQSEAIRQTAVQLLTFSSTFVGGATLAELCELLKHLDGTTSLSVGAVVALGEVCSKFSPAEVNDVEAAWKSKDAASYEAWWAIADLSRRASTAEQGLKEQQAAVAQLKQYFEIHREEKQDELNEVRRELQAVLSISDGADEACARGVLEGLGRGGKDATCTGAREAAEDTLRKLQSVKQELADVRAAEPELANLRAATQQLAERTAAVQEEEARVQDARRALEEREARARLVLEEREARVRRELEERVEMARASEEAAAREAKEHVAQEDARLHAAAEALVQKEESAQRTLEAAAARERATREAAESVEQKQAQLQEALSEAAANAEDEKRLAALSAQARREMAAREETLARRETEVKRALEAKGEAESAGRQARTALEALANQEAKVRAAAEAAAANESRVRDAEAALKEREKALQLEKDRVAREAQQVVEAVKTVGDRDAELERARAQCADMLAALRGELQECTAATADQTADVAAARAAREQADRQRAALDAELAEARRQLEEVRAAETTAKGEAQRQLGAAQKAAGREKEREREAREAEARAAAAAEKLQLAKDEVAEDAQKVLQAIKNVKDKDAELDRARKECEATQAKLLSELQECTAATEAQTAALERAQTRALGQGDTLNRELEEARRQLAEANAAETRANGEVQAQLDRARHTAEQEKERHAAAEGELNVQLREAELAKGQALEAHAQEMRAKTLALKRYESRAAECAAQLQRYEAQAAADGTCIDKLRNLLSDTGTGDTCYIATAATVRVQQLQRELAECEAKRAAAQVAAREAADRAKAAAEKEVAGKLEDTKAAADAATAAAVAEAREEARAAQGVAVADALTNARAQHEIAMAEAVRQVQARVAAEVQAAAKALNEQQAACTAQIEELRRQLAESAKEADTQREAAAVQSRRANDLEVRQTHAVDAVRQEREEKEQLARRVAELEKGAAEVGQQLGCDAAKAPCNLLELLRDADEERDRQAKGRAEELIQIRSAHAQDVHRLKEVHAQQVRQLGAEHAAKVAGLEQAHVQAVQTLETAHKAALEAKTVENANMRKDVYAAEAKVRDATERQAAAEAKVQVCTKELQTAREQLAANVQLRATAHSERLKVDECVRQLHEAMHLDGAVYTDACEVMKAAAAQIKELRPVQQKSAQVLARAHQVHVNLKALRAALGCGDQEQDCAGRASGLLDLLRPAGSFVDPVARAHELVDMEAAVMNMLPEKAKADRSSVQDMLKAWAGTSLANVRSQQEKYEAAGAKKIAGQVATTLKLTQGPRFSPEAFLTQVKEYADVHSRFFNAIQGIAAFAKYTGDIASANGAKELTDWFMWRMRQYSPLLTVAWRAAQTLGLITTKDDTGWTVRGEGHDVLLYNDLFNNVRLHDITTELNRVVANARTAREP